MIIGRALAGSLKLSAFSFATQTSLTAAHRMLAYTDIAFLKSLNSARAADAARGGTMSRILKLNGHINLTKIQTDNWLQTLLWVK